MNQIMFSSKSDRWETPQDFFDKLDAEFHFNLDPCADENNHKCKDYFTKEQDGLLQDWGGGACFATRHTGIRKPASGRRNVMRKGRNREPQLFY